LNLRTIGRKEIVDIPTLKLLGLTAKIDTGAYTSSIHCVSIEEVENGISCLFDNPKHLEVLDHCVLFKDYKKKVVKSSNGHVEERYAIWTEILIGGETFPIELTLTSRIEMKSPLLLGRKFLKKKYLVDVSKKHLLKN
jgi:hypothetical protein